MMGEGAAPMLAALPFWLRPDSTSTVGPFYMTAFIESSHALAMPSTLAPHRLDAGRYVLSSRFGRLLTEQDTLSEGLARVVTFPHFLVGYG